MLKESTGERKVEILTEKERKLISLLRELPFGKVEISIENNQPVRIMQIKENIVL
jgi:hypothetical protein